MTNPNVGHVTDALLATLAAVTGRPFGDHEAPGADRTTPDPPYGIVYLIPGGSTGASLAGPVCEVVRVWQVTSIAPTRKGATALAQRVFDTVLGLPVSITPMPSTVVTSCAHDSHGGVTREGRLFNAIDRFALTLDTTT